MCHMKFKLFILSILVLAIIAFTININIVKSNNPYPDNANNSQPTIPISNIDIYSKIDNKLKDNQFLNYDFPDSKSYSIIRYNNKDYSITSINEYNALNNDSLDISLNHNETFIISLPIFTTVTYSWKILNSLNDTILTLDHVSSINLNPKDDESNEIIYGSGEGRQNFYFTAIRNGSITINLENSSDAYKSTDNFKINFNIYIS